MGNKVVNFRGKPRHAFFGNPVLGPVFALQNPVAGAYPVVMHSLNRCLCDIRPRASDMCRGK
jgi:hypothetical protein